MIRVTVDPVFGFCMVEEPGFHAACSIHTASLQLFTQQLVSTVTALKPKARGVCAYTFLSTCTALVRTMRRRPLHTNNRTRVK